MEIPQDIKEMLEPGERILWSDKPSRIPFILKNSGFSILGIPLLAFPLIALKPILPKAASEPLILLFLTFWYAILGLIFFGAPIYALLTWKNVFYVLTDRRILVRKGLIGIDYDVLRLDTIQQVNIDVGLWDRIYRTGTLTIQAIGVTPLRLYCIKNPRKIQVTINKAIEASRRSSSQQP